MSDRPKRQPANPEQDGKPQEDLTGRDRLVSSVLFSWGGHFAFIIAGFIMPRMIDRRLGQELLGVWDFAWSLVSYFGLVQVGINSSVNRYVARYRAACDVSGVNRIVSSASCVLGIAGVLVIGLTVTFSLLLPRLFGARLGENVVDTQWVVLFLGASLGIEISFTAFSGVLTGCHRWELHNIIKGGWHAVTVAGMIIALLRGGGLRSLAVITSAGYILAGITRVILAHRVCEGLRLRPSLIGWDTIRKLFVFGGKTLIPSVSNMLLNQTTSIMIIAYLGPAALALYTRPRSLVHNVNILVNKMAMTLTPTASSLQSTKNLEGVRELLIKSVRYSFHMVLPMVLVLVVFGGAVLRFWMGPRYANNVVPAILAVGYLATMSQAPVLRILMGMNAHGRAGVAQLAASLCSAGLALLAIGLLRWGITGVAIAVTLPLTITNWTYLPYLVCRKVGLDLRRYFLSVTVGPAVHVLPFVICLVVARLVFHTQPVIGLLWGGVIGSIVLSVLYWQYVLPQSICVKILSTLRFSGVR